MTPRHRSLWAALDWSYQLLAPELQRFFARLSVFQGGWTLEAAEPVCDEPKALHCLEQLRECSLVQAAESGGEIRFRLLETLREYGAEHLEPEERTAVADRHASYYLALTERAKPELAGEDPVAWLDRLEREHDNLRAALAWLEARGRVEEALRLGGALGWFWARRYYWREGREYLARLLALPGTEARTATRAKALQVAGNMAWQSGDPVAARPLFEASLAIYRELGDKRNIAWSLNWLAYPQGQAGWALFEESLGIFQELGDRRGIADSLLNLGHLQWHTGEYGRACPLLEESLAIFQELRDKPMIVRSLVSMGQMAREQRELRRARALFEESLAISWELGDKIGIGQSLDELGNLARGLGEYEEARVRFEDLLAINRELGEKPLIALSLTRLGGVARDQGEYGEAQALFEESMAIYQELGDRSDIAWALVHLGDVAADQEEYGTARSLLEESLATFRELDNKYGIAYALNSLGRVAADQGEYRAARALLEESLAIFEELVHKDGIVHDLEALAAVAALQRQSERAARLSGAAEGLREAVGVLLPPADRARHDRFVAAVRTALGEEAFSSAWAEGLAMGLDGATNYALAR
jgi:tetratricopeptide (TPR) repeat protein